MGNELQGGGRDEGLGQVMNGVSMRGMVSPPANWINGEETEGSVVRPLKGGDSNSDLGKDPY